MQRLISDGCDEHRKELGTGWPQLSSLLSDAQKVRAGGVCHMGKLRSRNRTGLT